MEKYSKRTVWIHWVSAILIAVLIYTGISMENASLSQEKFTLYKIHFFMGNLVFLLTIVRIYALFKDRRPSTLYSPKSLHQKFISIVHYSFYVVLLWMCISGIASLSLEGILPALQSGQLSDLPEISKDGFHPIMLSHHVIAKIVFLLLLFHIMGFLIHLVRKRENTLKRIWFKNKHGKRKYNCRSNQ